MNASSKQFKACEDGNELFSGEMKTLQTKHVKYLTKWKSQISISISFQHYQTQVFSYMSDCMSSYMSALKTKVMEKQSTMKKAFQDTKKVDISFTCLQKDGKEKG